jgi:hypothetical protein
MLYMSVGFMGPLSIAGKACDQDLLTSGLAGWIDGIERCACRGAAGFRSSEPLATKPPKYVVNTTKR